MQGVPNSMRKKFSASAGQQKLFIKLSFVCNQDLRLQLCDATWRIMRYLKLLQKLTGERADRTSRFF